MDDEGQSAAFDGSRRILPTRLFRPAPSGPAFGTSEDVDLKGFWTELDEQTERGVAVLAAGYLEWRLRESIKCCFPIWDKRTTHIFGSDKGPGRLGFWESSEVAYGLGLIGPTSLEDLQRIGWIRNKFAHHPSVNSFDDARVRKFVDDLETPGIIAAAIEASVANNELLGKVHFPPGRRQKYVHTAHELAFAIYEAGHHVLKTVPPRTAPDKYW